MFVGMLVRTKGYVLSPLTTFQDGGQGVVLAPRSPNDSAKISTVDCRPSHDGGWTIMGPMAPYTPCVGH